MNEINTLSVNYEEIMNSVIGINSDSSNRIGKKHLEEIMIHTHRKAPIKKGTLLSQLRCKLLIDERYILQYLHGLEAFEIIKINSGMVYWCFDDNNKGVSE